MITLNDYLYSGNTILGILHSYESDLRREVRSTRSQVDLAHCNFLMQMAGLLEHNNFLTLQSQRMHEFYSYLAQRYPHLAFTLKGRIKSLIRAEGKFNGYVTEFIYDYHQKNGTYPTWPNLKERLTCFRDLIAYRIVISLPRCNLKPGMNLEEEELRYLYEIAEALPDFLEENGFTAELSGQPLSPRSPLDGAVRPYYRDYVAEPKESGYRSLHVTFYDNVARCHTEVQLRTKAMDDVAKMGTANHRSYEQQQQELRARRESIPPGECPEFDQAWERGEKLQSILLKDVDVNMFTAISNEVMNDDCGLFRGRLITPYEHLSRFQNDFL